MTPARSRLALALLISFGALLLAVVLGVVDPLDRWVESQLPSPQAGGAVWRFRQVGNHIAEWAGPQIEAVVALALAWRLRRRWWMTFSAVLTPIALAAVTVVLLKLAVGRVGPDGSQHDVLGYWPSGHTAMAVVCTGSLALARGGRWPWVAAAWSCLVGAVMIGIRAHWLTDVVGGLLLGGLVLTVAATRSRPAVEPSAVQSSSG